MTERKTNEGGKKKKQLGVLGSNHLYGNSSKETNLETIL